MKERKNVNNESSEKRGSINLVFLGVASVIIAIVTTTISLAVYHYSGDIYLDRSRPGYLPDEAEVGDNGDDVEYKFDKTGEMTMNILEEYIENLEGKVKDLDAYDKPYGAAALSDERLGIPAEQNEE